MTAKRTEEPAFPIGSGDMRDPTGMTLRDYFAAKAMQGLCANPDPQTTAASPQQIAGWSYAQADSMLKAREA